MPDFIIKDCKIGCDFEGFVYDSTMGIYVSATRFIKNTGKNPKMKGGYALSHDRDALEAAVPPVVLLRKNKAEFVEHIITAQQLLRGLVPGKHMRIDYLPTAIIDEEEAQHHNFTKMPIYNGLTRKKIEHKNVSGDLQTAGMHIHFGHNIKDLNFNFDFVKAFHEMVYLPLIKLEPKNDRAKFYGEPGEFKLKQYTAETSGCECRSLSAFFCSTPELVGEVFDRSYDLVKAFK